ncbi:MAG: GNAT family N-acetyltransferase [Hyphomonas sp.]|nr:GNAT family N-acetyltransferase [Hyphomonas sp.]
MSLKNWTARERPGQWPLTGDRVVLEPLDWTDHLEGLYQAVAAPDVADIWKYMPLGPFESQEQFQEIFERVAGDLGWEVMIIRRTRGGDVLGMASYMRIREAHGSAEIGCVAFGPDLKRSAEATEAMSLMAGHVFDELGYRRYEWKCHNDNAASRRAAERFGFAFEGVFRNDMVVKGKSRDTAWFAMTDEDWPVLRKAFKAWLSAKNFDASGTQKKRLEAFR